jgi:hypothetical protein
MQLSELSPPNQRLPIVNTVRKDRNIIRNCFARSTVEVVGIES